YPFIYVPQLRAPLSSIHLIYMFYNFPPRNGPVQPLEKQPPSVAALPPSLSRLFSFCIQSILYTKSKKRIFTYGDWGGGRAGTSYAMGERTGLLLTGPPHPQLVSLLFHSEKVEGKRGEGGT